METQNGEVTALVVPAEATPGGALQIGGGASLATVEKRLNEFRAFVKRVLVEGIDFGRVGDVDKKCLYKAGAERICQLYNLAPRFTADVATEDFGRAIPFFNYRLKCQLIHRPSGQVVGEGVGSCNSMESKYRYRVQWWNDSGKNPPQGQGWEQTRNKKWKKRAENVDTADVGNTVLKMAKKRAFIDATLTVAAASEFFTQDIDDLEVDDNMLRDDTGRPPSGAPGSEAAATDWEGAIAICSSLQSFQALVARIAREPSAVRNRLKPKLEAKREEIRAAAEAKAAQAKHEEADPPPAGDEDWIDPGPPDDIPLGGEDDGGAR